MFLVEIKKKKKSSKGRWDRKSIVIDVLMEVPFEKKIQVNKCIKLNC